MKLKVLSKEETKKLEWHSTPIENLVYHYSFNPYFYRIQKWYAVNGLTTKDPQKDFFEKLIELIGFEPSYYKTYEYRTAVWGFEWEEELFILYRSERGLSIQTSPKFSKDKIEKFLIEFSGLLGTSNLDTPFEEK